VASKIKNMSRLTTHFSVSVDCQFKPAGSRRESSGTNPGTLLAPMVLMTWLTDDGIDD